MVRTFEEWWKTVPEDLKTRTRKGDEANKVIIKSSKLCFASSTPSRKT